MQKDFILINSCVQDYAKYQQKVVLLKHYLKLKISDLLADENFIQQTESHRSYSDSELLFFEKESDLEIEIIIRKKNPEEFV